MAIVPRIYQSIFILQGPAEVFLLSAIPPSSANPTADVNTIKINASGVPETANGFLGSLEGPAVITITESCNEIRDDQHESPIDAGFTTTEAEIAFSMKETAPAKLYIPFTERVNSSVASQTAGPSGGQIIDILQLGGQRLPDAALWVFCIVARDNTLGTNTFTYIVPYFAVLKSAVQGEFSRAKETVWKITMQCIADLSRVPGDEIMQIVRTAASS